MYLFVFLSVCVYLSMYVFIYLYGKYMVIKYMVIKYMYMYFYIHIHIHIHIHMYLEERISDAGLRTIRAHVCVLVCARAPVCASAHVYPRRTVRAPSAGVDRVRLGSQAFYGATTFSANIGAWNIASVTSLSNVCAAFGRRRATAAGALGRGSVRRGTCGDRTADAHAHVCVHVYVLAAVDVDVCTQGCAEGRWNAIVYIYM